MTDKTRNYDRFGCVVHTLSWDEYECCFYNRGTGDSGPFCTHKQAWFYNRHAKLETCHWCARRKWVEIEDLTACPMVQTYLNHVKDMARPDRVVPGDENYDRWRGDVA